MSKASSSSLAIAVAVLVCVLALVVALIDGGGVYTPLEELEVRPRVVEPEPVRPVPAELAAQWEEIGSLREEGDFLGAADRYLVLIGRLAVLWGEDSPELAPYYYNFAFCLQMAGSVRDCEQVLIEARARWPLDLRLAVLDASLRSAAALRTGKLDEELEALYESILESRTHPHLRGLGVRPESIYTQWAAVLLEAGEHGRALGCVDRALELAPDHVPGRTMKARVLLSMQRGAEARAILEPLVTRGGDMELEYYLGVALFDEGRAGEAHARLAPILASLERDPDMVEEKLLTNLRVYTARASIDLGRRHAAVETLLPALVENPFDVEVLAVLVEAVPRAAAAARGRRNLERGAHASLERAAGFATAGGDEPGAAYFRGLSLLVTGRLGAAFDDLRLALRESPRSIELHQAYGEALESLGRLGRAQANCDEAFENTGASSFLLDRARIGAIRGRVEEARRILEDPRLVTPPGAGAGAQTGRAPMTGVAARLRLYLELRDLGAVRAFFREHRVDETSEPVIALTRAEQMVLERQPAQARVILARRPLRLPHLETWRRVLLKIIEVELEGDASSATLAGLDTSDLLDLPRFVQSADYLRKSSVLSSELADELERLRVLVVRRRGLLDAIDEAISDADGAVAVARWLELLDLYVDSGAQRKAKELAWYLLDEDPVDVAGFVRLAETLARPQDVVERLSVAERGLRIDPEHERLTELRDRAREALGLPGPVTSR